ncbi:hypothetical protein L3Q82_024192, partial [Scortum barcoo]
MKTNERSGVEDHRVPTALLPLYLSLCSPLHSHPFPLSFIPPSVPSSPSTLLSSSLFHYLLPSLPPSVSFHVVTHYSADISPSVPPSLRQALPYWCWPSPLCLGLDGTEGERGGDVPDGQTLNSRGEGRDGGMKGETRKRRGEEKREEKGEEKRKRRRRRRRERRGEPGGQNADQGTNHEASTPSVGNSSSLPLPSRSLSISSAVCSLRNENQLSGRALAFTPLRETAEGQGRRVRQREAKAGGKRHQGEGDKSERKRGRFGLRRHLQALQDCFECTDWEVFKEGTDLDGYTSSVLSYLKFCTDAVLPTNDHQGFPKSKTIAGQHSEAPTQSLTSKIIIPAGLDQYQFAYRENRSTEDAVSIALHTALTHLQLPNTYVRMLFVDFSSAFNTVIPDKLVLKLHNLGLPLIAVPLDQGLPHNLTNRPQVVRIGDWPDAEEGPTYCRRPYPPGKMD